MPSFTLTPEVLASVAGILLSLLFSYVPKLNTLFAGLDPTYKRLSMLLLLLIVAAAVYGLGCGGIVTTGLTCDKQGFAQLIWIFILAVIANQSAYQLTPQTQAVIDVKAKLP